MTLLNITPKKADWKDVVIITIEILLAMYITFGYLDINNRVNLTVKVWQDYYEKQCNPSFNTGGLNTGGSFPLKLIHPNSTLPIQKGDIDGKDW
jgi:hypothetical protein